jgi:hypothetical protein
VVILEGRQQNESLAATIVKIARKERSTRLSRRDLFDLVKRDCPPDHKAHWQGPHCSSGTVVGLLQNAGSEKIESVWLDGLNQSHVRKVGELRQLIEAEGVLFWSNWRDDGYWRLVDAKWLTAHRDIHNWLNRQWLGGTRCAFCAMHENPMTNELEPLDVSAGRLRSRIVHNRCRSHLLAWYEIAAKYATEEEAAAADKAAGRVSRYEKVERAAAAIGVSA